MHLTPPSSPSTQHCFGPDALTRAILHMDGLLDRFSIPFGCSGLPVARCGCLPAIVSAGSPSKTYMRRIVAGFALVALPREFSATSRAEYLGTGFVRPAKESALNNIRQSSRENPPAFNQRVRHSISTTIPVWLSATDLCTCSLVRC